MPDSLVFPVGDLVLNTKEDGKAVIKGLSDVIAHYGSASVADLMSLIDIPSTYNDVEWGWSSTDGFGIRKGSGCVVLFSPDATPLPIRTKTGPIDEFKPFFKSVVGRMKADGLSEVKIAHYLGLHTSTVRELLN